MKVDDIACFFVDSGVGRLAATDLALKISEHLGKRVSPKLLANRLAKYGIHPKKHKGVMRYFIDQFISSPPREDSPEPASSKGVNVSMIPGVYVTAEDIAAGWKECLRQRPIYDGEVN